MATVTNAVSDYGIREGKYIEWLGSRLKMGIATVTFGSSEDYATDGIAVESDLKSALNLSTITVAVPLTSDMDGYLLTYDSANGKIQAWVTGASDGTAFSELADTSSAINDKVVKMLVIGT